MINATATPARHVRNMRRLPTRAPSTSSSSAAQTRSPAIRAGTRSATYRVRGMPTQHSAFTPRSRWRSTNGALRTADPPAARSFPRPAREGRSNGAQRPTSCSSSATSARIPIRATPPTAARSPISRIATSGALARQTPDRRESGRTEWHRVVLFRNLRRDRRRVPEEGRQVYIEGSLRTQRYAVQKASGATAPTSSRAEMQMLGGGASSVVESTGSAARESTPEAPQSPPSSRVARPAAVPTMASTTRHPFASPHHASQLELALS